MDDVRTRSDLPPERNLYRSDWGVRDLTGIRNYHRGHRVDRVYDKWLETKPSFRKLCAAASTATPRRIHIAAVEVPSRKDDLARLFDDLRRTRHHVTTSIAPMGDRGKFANLNVALENVDPNALDWLILTDDDIAVPPGFLDRFIVACEMAGLRAAMPAHRFRSHAAFAVTMRHWDSLVRTTRFVETGPMTAFRAEMVPLVLPFPVTRWAWGLDLLWSEIAHRRNWDIGVVDATPIEHLRPVSASYDRDLAAAEAEALMKEHGITPDNRQYLRNVRTTRRWPDGRVRTRSGG